VIVQQLSKDLRYALRTLRRNPGFAAIAVISLALGIGANAAIFSLINAVLLRPLPVRDAAGLVLLSDGNAEGRSFAAPRPGRLDLYSYPLYKRLREQSQVFEGLAAQQSYSTTSLVRWNGSAGELSADNASGRLVSANYFSVMGVSAYRGRAFLPEDETAPGANPVVVLSHAYWLRRLAGNPAVVGDHLTINGHQYTVVGVAAPGFTGSKVGDSTDFWVPVTMQAELMRTDPMLGQRDAWWLLLIGRSRPGVALASAEANVNLTLQQFLSEDRSVRDGGAIRIGLESGAKGVSRLRRTFRDPLLALMVGVGLLLLIVCLNVSHLLLARSVHRQREMSIRTALGASRGRLIQQLLTEGLVLSALGVAAAILVTRWLSDGLVSLAASGGSPLALDVSTDWRVSSFMVLLALGTALLLGLAPAWQASRGDVQQVLRATAQSVTHSGSRRVVSRITLASQVAFSVVLLVGAGLLAGSLSHLRDLNKGFDEAHVLLVDINPRLTGLSEEQVLSFYDDVLQRVTTTPGVRGASLSRYGLLSGGQLSGRIALSTAAEEARDVQRGIVTPSYFETVGMRVTRGRSFTREDHENAPRVAVINETLAGRLAGGADVLGQHFRFVPAPAEARDIEVVGIVMDARTNGLRREAQPIVYQPVAQARDFLGSLEVQAVGDPSLLAGQIRRTLAEARPDLPVLSVRTMRSQVERSLMQERLMAALSLAFGLAALFLVFVGLYGVIAQWAATRTREIGVRMALGASPGSVRWMVLREAFILVLGGLVVGVPAAVGASQLLRGLLFGLDPMNPLILSVVALAMLGVGLLAAYVPARRASRVDPMAALRCD
jgi:predicted permease